MYTYMPPEHKDSKHVTQNIGMRKNTKKLIESYVLDKDYIYDKY